MPACSKAKNPRGAEIIFEELAHTYRSTINGQEIKYTSGTGFVGQYFPPFDPTGEITKRCAAKEGITVEEIQAKWKKKGQDSCRFGTRCHEVCEDVELGRTIQNTAQNVKEEETFKQAIKMATAFRSRLNILGVEKIVFDPGLRISGTIDLFGQSRKDGTYIIIDHKTNASIDTENKYNKFALDPISHVPDLNFYHYALQLNLYEYLLKFGSYVPKDAKFKLFLNHLTETSAKLIELPDMQSEIREMLIDHLIR